MIEFAKFCLFVSIGIFASLLLVRLMAWLERR